MKLNNLILPLALALVAALATTTGCTHKYTKGKVTDIPHPAGVTSGDHTPGIPPAPPMEPPSAAPISTPISTPTSVPNPPGTTPTSDINLENYTQDRVALAANTVHFKFDSAVVQDQEQANIAAVAQALADANLKLLIEGHCDERGTEEYNRALGERRALALREALGKANIDPMRIKTISYGKDQPADPGHDDAAWAKNRRGVFVLLHPKTPVP
jgi:peptidoglycan-associated lipoprotein